MSRDNILLRIKLNNHNKKLKLFRILLEHLHPNRPKMGLTSLTFNIDNGYLEGLVRGFKAGILRQADYLNLIQCETLEGRATGFFINFGTHWHT